MRDEINKTIDALIKIARTQNGRLDPDQMKKAFTGIDAGTDELLYVLQRLKQDGIHLETVIYPSGSSNTSPGTHKEPSDDEKEWLKKYISDLQNSGDIDKLYKQYLPLITRIATEMNCEEMLFQDIVQEAGLALWTATVDGEALDELYIENRIRKELCKAISVQVNIKKSDNTLVEKVIKLEEAIREVNDGDGESFSVGELAILLDMTTDEINDILRLVGDK